jgi:hypothetical protein
VAVATSSPSGYTQTVSAPTPSSIPRTSREGPASATLRPTPSASTTDPADLVSRARPRARRRLRLRA